MAEGSTRPCGGCFDEEMNKIVWEDLTSESNPDMDCSKMSVTKVSELFRQLAVEVRVHFLLFYFTPQPPIYLHCHLNFLNLSFL